MRKSFKMASKGKVSKEAEAAVLLQRFNQLRSEQRHIASKIAELDGDKNEHELVLDALKGVDPDRKCFRMVGGVLAERTAKEVIPSLQHNINQLKMVVKKLKDQLEEKGKEVNQFREKHNIRIRGEGEGDSGPQKEESADNSSTQGILVA